MTVDYLIKRTIYVALCACGEKDIRDRYPPRERLCPCGKWVSYKEESWVGPDIKNKIRVN